MPATSEEELLLGCPNRNAQTESRLATMNPPTTCPFCNRISSGVPLAENQHAAAFQDAYPVSDGHALVIPRVHESDFLDLDSVVQSGMFELATKVANQFLEDPDVTGCNLGINIGSSAGQTVTHAHVHVIPRRDGDVEDPRRGIRWVIPSKAKYWD